MNRRILDNVTITALDKHGDPELTKSVSDMFGVGTLVEDAKIQQVTFNKSMLGLSVTNMSGIIRKLANELRPSSLDGSVVDSNGNSHTVSVEAVSLLKAIVFYRITSPSLVSSCIGVLLTEIDNHFKGQSPKALVTLSLDGEGEIENKNTNLMKYCRTEIFDLLREAGVNIG